MPPLVSGIVPTYIRADLLVRCIESNQKQTFAVWLHRPYLDLYRRDSLVAGGRRLLARRITHETSLFLAQKRYSRTCVICLEFLWGNPFSRRTWRMLTGAAIGPAWRKFKSFHHPKRSNDTKMESPPDLITNE